MSTLDETQRPHRPNTVHGSLGCETAALSRAAALPFRDNEKTVSATVRPLLATVCGAQKCRKLG
jgi:hypothetical protein